MLGRLFNQKAKEEEFWKWFQNNSDRYLSLDKSNRGILFKELNQEIKKIDPNLTFEFGPKLGDGLREFIISANGIKESFPAVRKLVDAAPNIPKWAIIAFRQPKPSYKQITFKGITVHFDDVYFAYCKDKGKIGLELYIRGYEDSRDWIATTFLLLDMVLGEFDTEMSISWIERKGLNEKEIGTFYKIHDLPTLVDDYKREFGN
jgi:hypothetical protein